MLRTKLFTAAAAAALLTAPAAMAQTAPAAPAAPAAVQTPAAAATVIDVLKAQGQFSTLLRALDQAQLTETLATRPAVTLFAPSDAAFAALPEAERTRLLDPANAQELRNLLLYHVIVAELTTDQIKGARGDVPTAGGVAINIDGTTDPIAVGAAKITQAEIDASNGGVFVIDKVLNPSDAAQGDGAAEAEAGAPPAAEAAAAADGAARPAQPGETAPGGEPAAAVSTTAAPPVSNPTDGQVDDAEDPANPAPTPN